VREHVPINVLVSLEADTHKYVHLREESEETAEDQAPHIQSQIVTMAKGDILYFRGDLVHAGASYDRENFRLHCFMDSPSVKRVKNRTWLIEKHAPAELKRIIFGS